jgi:5'-3' exonuclease
VRERHARRSAKSADSCHPRRGWGHPEVRRAAASIPDYLALVGDSADGYPGLPGWGAKSTAAVLAKFGPRNRSSLRRSARRAAKRFLKSIARLQHTSNAAVGTLLRVMTDREAPAASRVRAADVVLQTALRGMEIEDIDARLRQLEEAAEANQGRRR